MASPIARGTILSDRYRVDGLLGSGGMGAVWAAIELRTKRPVAIKVIREGLHSKSELHKRILREARAEDQTDDAPVLSLNEEVLLAERRALERALERTGGNRSRAARLLGVSRSSLYSKLEEHALL
jgi:transcriptional regulator with PAS, ATPase and Fis domain